MSWPAENLYEEVEPVAVLDARLSDAGREFLVKFLDAEEDSWVAALCLQTLSVAFGCCILPATTRNKILAKASSWLRQQIACIDACDRG